MNSLWNLRILSNMGTSLSSGGRNVSLQGREWDKWTSLLKTTDNDRSLLLRIRLVTLASILRLESRQLSDPRTSLFK